ncbi:Zinc finger C2H2 type [Paragonimus heterotremus]|uniref:Zinc finger C2H2 type n=1 Tax=Paragonimus heterotremus TaxID=100268 RepID=A0A8J4SW48_9TREM|nr:Zinc finger C2H2 type [Paragonimus heterotremus]
MTHSIRSLRKPSLSVRTRALLQKFNERTYHQHTVAWNGTEMRLRTRNIPPTWSMGVKSPDVSPTASAVVPMSESCAQNTNDALMNRANQHTLLETETNNNRTNHISHTGSSSSVSSTDSTESHSVCKWERCGAIVDQSELIAHIQHVHVFPQIMTGRRKYFACLWEGCRVFRQPSVSASWLDNHILHHTDAKGKPFRCIFDGCTLRFSTSILLERHVRHFHMRATRTRAPSNPLIPSMNSTPVKSSSDNGMLVKETDTTDQTIEETAKVHTSPVSNARRNSRRRRKLRCYRVRRIDFYDRRTQCVIGTRLKLLNLLNTTDSHMLCTTPGKTNQPSACALQPFVLPDQLLAPPPSPRLRSTVVPKAVSSSQFISTSSKVMPERREHLALLLTIPHKFVGQRLFNNQLEFLVRWTGEYEFSRPPPIWISQKDVQAARALGSI